MGVISFHGKGYRTASCEKHLIYKEEGKRDKNNQSGCGAFKDDFFKGLSFRECVFGGSALLTGVGGILLLHFYFGVGINTAITLCMPVIGIIGLCGFIIKTD